MVWRALLILECAAIQAEEHFFGGGLTRRCWRPDWLMRLRQLVSEAARIEEAPSMKAIEHNHRHGRVVGVVAKLPKLRSQAPQVHTDRVKVILVRQVIQGPHGVLLHEALASFCTDGSALRQRLGQSSAKRGQRQNDAVNEAIVDPCVLDS